MEQIYHYKLIIAYDGTDYAGWQVQPDRETIAGLLIKRFRGVFKCDLSLLGASRTDAGVHANGQVARVITALNIDPEAMRAAWNNALPVSIVIRSITKNCSIPSCSVGITASSRAQMPLQPSCRIKSGTGIQCSGVCGSQIESAAASSRACSGIQCSGVCRSQIENTRPFHPHINVKEKHYSYTIFTSNPGPFKGRQGYYSPELARTINWEKFSQVLQLFVGTHNVTAFSRIEGDKDPLRTISSITVTGLSGHTARLPGVGQSLPWARSRDPGHVNRESVVIHIRGKSFLQHQIRRIVGAAISVGIRDDLPVSYIQHLLDNPTEEPESLSKAPACGLCLEEIIYKV